MDPTELIQQGIKYLGQESEDQAVRCFQDALTLHRDPQRASKIDFNEVGEEMLEAMAGMAELIWTFF